MKNIIDNSDNEQELRNNTINKSLKGILKSKEDAIFKLIYDKDGSLYYSIPFLLPEEDKLFICISSQIGCPEKCSFCATWDKRFKQNLSKDDIKNQIMTSIEKAEEFWKKDTISLRFEGMWEATYNLENILNWVYEIKTKLLHKFKNIEVSISTAWNNSGWLLQFIDKIKTLKDMGMIIKIQISIHAIFDDNIINWKEINDELFKNKIWDIYELSNSIWIKPRINFLLLNYPNWKNNYNNDILKKITENLDGKNIKIRLTKYSETHKWFSSPDIQKYEEVKNILEAKWFIVSIWNILWKDIDAWCWMLDYKNNNNSGKIESIFQNKKLIDIICPNTEKSIDYYEKWYLKHGKESIQKLNDKTKYLDFVENKFSECFSKKWYIEEKPVNITSQIDKTVDFVGSKISALKKYIIKEDFGEIGRYLIQNSMKLKSLKTLKTNIPQIFGCYYKCMGVLAKPELERVINDTFEYFTSSEYLNIPFEDICIKINSNDKDLMSAIAGIDSRIIREIDKSNIEHYIHKYGMENENITWRDFNIGIRRKWTNDYFSCATFVIMENKHKKIAIDMGISNWSLSMCKFGTNSTIPSSRMADIINIDTIEKEKFADALIAVSILLKENITKHPKKNFRQKFRMYLDALNYWNKKFQYTNDELTNIMIKYLNAEYNYNFDENKENYSKIFALYEK